MSFNSLKYLIFLAVVSAVYWIMPHKWRRWPLLAASAVFYMLWRPEMVFLLIASSAAAYLFARFMDASSGRRRKSLLVLSLVFVLGALFIFKYLDFIGDSILSVMAAAGLPPFTMPPLILPIGISFYSFMLSGYLIDVYRGRKAERNFIDFILFSSFFPYILAGPIERADNILPQIKSEKRFSYEYVKSGGTLILWGLFKKMVLADGLAVMTDSAYASSGTASGAALFIAAVAYSFQIYCDFSGYTDIARGSAKILGFDLIRNFDAPYLAVSVRDFWRRWHMSLSFWFRDYLYFPLGGSRCSMRRRIFNLMVVFAVSGLWHGAAWTFVLWGIIHGVYQAASVLTNKARKKARAFLKIRDGSALYRIWSIGWTFALVTFAWIFFRASNAGQAWQVISRIFTAFHPADLTSLGTTPRQGVMLFICAVFVAMADIAGCHKAWEKLRGSAWGRWIVWLALAGAVVLFGSYGPGYDPQQFVYFKF